MFTAIEIADWYLSKVDREAGNAMTLLKLHKLVFYTQAWQLAIEKRAILDEDVLAGRHGPFFESLQRHYADAPCMALPMPAKVNKDIEDDMQLCSMLFDIQDSYGRMEASQLEEMICSEKPWLKARGALKRDDDAAPVISREEIGTYYRERLDEAIHAH